MSDYNADDLRLYYLDYLFEMMKAFPADEGRARWEAWDYLVQYSSDIRRLLLHQLFEENLN
jgi:hypothetical protein